MNEQTRTAKWKFAFSRRWLGYLALLILFAIACGLLSSWQFDRREERVAENDRIIENYDREAVPIAEALPQVTDFDESQEWLPVALTGHYLASDQVLARSRPMDGMPGFEILTPFETEDGRVFIVNRGWLPTGSAQDYPDAVPTPPTGTVTVVARLKPGEPEIPGRSAPEGQIATIHLETFAELYGADRTYTEAYGIVASEQPAAETGKLGAKPALTEGNHLSYAFQWIIFALIAAIGLVLGVRNEYRHRNAADPKVKAAIARERARKARKGPTDAEEEDALLDEAAASR